jgi:hypothetical protein
MEDGAVEAHATLRRREDELRRRRLLERFASASDGWNCLESLKSNEYTTS